MEIEFQYLGRKEVESLLLSPHMRDVELEEFCKWTGQEVYQLDDGRVLAYDLISGRLYRSRIDARADLEARHQEIDRDLKKAEWEWHPLHGKLDSGFADRIDSIVDHLRSRLGVGTADLDLSLESVERLDFFLESRYGFDVPEEVVIEAVAYTGEVMVRNYGCQWQMKLDQSFTKVWEPWLIGPHGETFEIHSRLFDSLNEHGRISAQAAAYSMVYFDLAGGGNRGEY